MWGFQTSQLGRFCGSEGLKCGTGGCGKQTRSSRGTRRHVHRTGKAVIIHPMSHGLREDPFWLLADIASSPVYEPNAAELSPNGVSLTRIGLRFWANNLPGHHLTGKSAERPTIGGGRNDWLSPSGGVRSHAR